MRNYAKPMFQQRHYIAIAEMMRTVLDGNTKPEHYNTCERVLKAHIRMFKADNHKFDSHRFLRACGYSDPTIERLLST